MSAHSLYLLAAILGITATTFLTRGAFLLLPRRWQLPPSVQAPLRYAPIAAIAAIIAPDVLSIPLITEQAARAQYVQILGNPKLWGALVGGAIYLRGRNMGAAIGLGMLVFWGLRWALGG